MLLSFCYIIEWHGNDNCYKQSVSVMMLTTMMLTLVWRNLKKTQRYIDTRVTWQWWTSLLDRPHAVTTKDDRKPFWWVEFMAWVMTLSLHQSRLFYSEYAFRYESIMRRIWEIYLILTKRNTIHWPLNLVHMLNRDESKIDLSCMLHHSTILISFILES